jgi:hypothetical protein
MTRSQAKTKCERGESLTADEIHELLRERTEEGMPFNVKLSLPLALVVSGMVLVQGVKRAVRVARERFAKAVGR